MKQLFKFFLLIAVAIPGVANATALSANKSMKSRNVTATKSYLMTASATIYQGSLVCLVAAGTAEACAATAGNSQVVGVATEKVVDDSTFVGRISVEEGDFLLVATSIAQTDVNKVLFVVDDATVDETATTKIPAGVLTEFVSTTSGWVRVGPAIKRDRTVLITIPVMLNATLANGDFVTNFTPGFAGKILDWWYVTQVAVTTGSKAATMNLEINTTNVSTCTIPLASATMTPIGAVVASAGACTGTVAFDENDTLSIEAASVTTFVEGSGFFQIRVEEVN